jgi:hypothetical protein
MKFLKCALALPFIISTIGIVHAAKGDIFYNVPFHNVEIKAASKIYVNYNFDPSIQKLVCESDPSSNAITSVEWAYKDATRKIELPVTLKDKTGVEGHNIDPEGKLIITNDFGSSHHDGSIFVTCEYQKIS